MTPQTPRCCGKTPRPVPAGARRRPRPAARGPVDRDPRRWSPSGGGPWWCSAPAGASPRSTSSPPRCCAAHGAGPTVIISPLLALMRNQIAGGRAGRHPGRHHQLGQHRASGSEIYARGRRRRGRRAARQPGAAQQPGLPRRGAAPAGRDARACSWSTRRTASPTGATTSGPTTAGSRTLLDELPPGIPVLATTATANARVAVDVAEQLARERRRWSCAAPLDARVLHLGVVAAADRRAAAGAGWPSTCAELPGSGIVYTLTVAAAAGGRRVTCATGAIAVAAYSGQTEPAERLRRRGRPARQPGQGAGRHVARSAWGSTSPISGSSSTSARRRRRSPTTSRSAGPAAASSGPRWSCCPAPRTATSGTTSPRWASRRSRSCGRRSRRWTSGGAAVHRRARAAASTSAARGWR